MRTQSLAAATYLEIPVSPLLLRDKTKQGGNGGTPRTRRVKRIDDADLEGEDDVEDDVQLIASESRSVTLNSGGTLTLSASTKFMALSSADRNFVFGLIDKLEEYEQKNAEAEA
jgi:hypothetical protein